jgi:hypothetical protein
MLVETYPKLGDLDPYNYNGPSPDFCVSSEVVGQKFYMGLEMRI